MGRLREKLGLRRRRHLPDAAEGGEGPEAESTGDLKRKSGQQMLQLPHVQLYFSSARTASSDGEISEARISLQKSVEELESVLQAQLGQSSDKLQSNLGAFIAQGDDPLHTEPFKNVLAAVQEDQADRNQAASSRAGAVMQKMYPLTKLALGLTGTLTSSAGYAPVQIVTNGLTQAFEIAMSVPKQSEEVVAGLDSMAADDYLLAELQKMPGDVLDGPIVLGAIVLQTRLVEFLRKSILWLNKTFFAKFANCLIEPTQMTDARTELKKAQDALRSQLSVDTYLLMKWQKIATAQAELLNSLCSNEYHTAQLLKQKELHGTRLENSGMWALTDEKFKSWHGDAGGILWCPGLPGAGKTYITSRIVDELQISGRHRDVGVAYVYCESNRIRQQSETLVIEAMARQLIAQKPDLCFELKGFLQNPLPTADDRRILLGQVLDRFETTFLVLDALDEFSTDYGDRHRLACTLRNILRDCSTGQVRLCITSRAADGIWQALCTGTVPATVLDVRSSQSDIRALVENAYDEAARDHAVKWTYGNDELRQLVIDKVVEKSDCIFKLADLQIRAILRKPSARSAKSALDSLTKNVNDYYNEAMRRIASQEETKDMVYNLLTWLTFTLSPIHVHELELALSIRPGQSLDQDLDDQRVDVLRYAGLSEGLVTINKSSLISPDDESLIEDDVISDEPYTMNEHNTRISQGAQVTLAHESIREFLRDIHQPGIPVKGDKFLLHCCLTIMSSPIFVGNMEPIWQQWLHNNYFPSYARGCSVNFGSSAVEVPVFLFWVLSSWGQYVSDVDLTPDMVHEIQKIRGSATEGARAVRRDRWAGPLYYCAYKGWAEACKLLLHLEEEPNAFCKLSMDRSLPYETEETCLFAAVISGDVATVQVFLDDDRINPNLGKKHHREGHVTPLMQSCEQEDRDIVRMLLARTDVDVNTYGDNGGWGVGLPAILRANPGTIALLLERDDLDVNILRMGRRPVHHLANIGSSPSELEMLLESFKIDVNIRTEEAVPHARHMDERDWSSFCHKRTALMVAAFVGHPTQTSVLLKHPRIDVHLRDSQGMTALMLAAVGYTRDNTKSGTSKLGNAKSAKLQKSVQQHEETVRVLLKNSDSKVNERDVKGRTALIFASMGGVDPRWKGSEMFGGCEAQGSSRWYEHLTMKSSLCKSHHAGILRALLRDDEVEVNMTDDMGHTALNYATWTRDLIIREHDLEMQFLKEEVVESYRGLGPASDGAYLVPDVDVQGIMTEVQPRIDAMSKIQDILVASGAHLGEPIASFAYPEEYRLPWVFSWKEVKASEQQKMLESLISELESVV